MDVFDTKDIVPWVDLLLIKQSAQANIMTDLGWGVDELDLRSTDSYCIFLDPTFSLGPFSSNKGVHALNC
ncbi:hypothetical protein V2J09_006575 [Rumex salicifolius]